MVEGTHDTDIRQVALFHLNSFHMCEESRIVELMPRDPRGIGTRSLGMGAL